VHVSVDLATADGRRDRAIKGHIINIDYQYRSIIHIKWIVIIDTAGGLLINGERRHSLE
jgi:hypothetical protein